LRSPVFKLLPWAEPQAEGSARMGREAGTFRHRPNHYIPILKRTFPSPVRVHTSPPGTSCTPREKAREGVRKPTNTKVERHLTLPSNVSKCNFTSRIAPDCVGRFGALGVFLLSHLPTLLIHWWGVAHPSLPGPNDFPKKNAGNNSAPWASRLH
jgi:hypothetical protein